MKKLLERRCPVYRILIADNQPEWREFSRRVLVTQGYDVVLADTVDSLRSLLQRNDYALILVNADLMRGPFRKPIHDLFQRNADKPIIVVSVPSSVHATVQETRTAFKLGAKDCVDKPFSRERLLALVQKLLDEFVNHQIQTQEVCP
jgi:DNA-binding response OmpR family regulator